MEEIDAQEQLAYIRKVMEETRREIIGDGGDFMRWGILTVIGLLITYFHAFIRYPDKWIWIVWFVVVGLGWAFSIRTFIRARKNRVTTFSGKIAWRVWGGYGGAATILGFVGPMSGAYSTDYICAVLATVIGAAYFGTGLIFGTRWLPIFAVGWWCGSVIMFLYPVVHMLLLFALMMVCFQIIPGYVMYRRKKMNVGISK